MRQLRALDGESLYRSVWCESQILSDVLYKLEGDAQHPGNRDEGLDEFMVSKSGNLNGIYGLDLDTGMIQVKLTVEKTQDMKFGKLLKKAGYSDKIVRDYSSLLSSAVAMLKGAKLSFTQDGQEAVDVYDDGPSSCMKGSDSVRAYDSPNVAVAYVKVGERIVARSVVCIDPELGLRYICIYGNADVMLPLLEKAGYVQGSLEGCKLNLIMDGDMFVCPYLDCGTMVTPNGEWIDVDSGEFDSQSTSGFLNGCTCEDCDEHMHEDDSNWCEHTGCSLCDDCHANSHEYVDGNYYHHNSDEITQLHNGEYVMANDAYFVESEGGYFLDEDVTYSGYDGELYLNDDVVNAITNIYNFYSEACHKDNCTYINSSGKWVHDDLIGVYEQQLELNLC